MDGERVKRIGLVTAGLAAAGAVTGGAVGLLFAAVLASTIPLDTPGMFREILITGTIGGGVLGSVLGPAAAWMLMRHVPLWMAIGGTALGTLAGALASIPLGISQFFNFTALAGFGAAAVCLRIFTPGRPAIPSGNRRRR